MEPLLKEAPPREILVFPLVMVEEPMDVVLRPLVMEEFPTASLLFPLLMEVLPTVKAVFPSVKLVLPIDEASLVSLTQIRRRGSGFTRRQASHAHAARPALPAADGAATSCDPEKSRMLGVDSATPAWHKALLELKDVGSGRPHLTRVSP